MILQQMTYLVEIARNGFSISKAAATLRTSQPGISKQIRLLEEETQTQIFYREGKRLIGFTREGRVIFDHAQRIVQDAQNIRRIGEEYNSQGRGLLTVSTTPALACYALPPIVKEFRDSYPGVQIHVVVGEADQCVDGVISREADIAIAPHFQEVPKEFVMFHAFDWQRSLVALPDSPILSIPELTLADIAKYPIIALETKTVSLKRHFRENGLEPEYTITTSNPDVMKRYAALGLGVAVIATPTYDQERDAPLKARDVSHLFAPSRISLGIHRAAFLRNFTYDFIQMLAPRLTRQLVADQLHPARS